AGAGGPRRGGRGGREPAGGAAGRGRRGRPDPLRRRRGSPAPPGARGGRLAAPAALAPGAGEPRALRAGPRRPARRALKPLAALLLASLLALPGPAAAETRFSFVPLPAFDTDPNAGNTYGILPAVLFKDEEDRVRSILAPSVTYNEFRGITGTFRYFLYPNDVERMAVIASYSTKID